MTGKQKMKRLKKLQQSLFSRIAITKKLPEIYYNEIPEKHKIRKSRSARYRKLRTRKASWKMGSLQILMKLCKPYMLHFTSLDAREDITPHPFPLTLPYNKTHHTPQTTNSIRNPPPGRKMSLRGMSIVEGQFIVCQIACT